MLLLDHATAQVIENEVRPAVNAVPELTNEADERREIVRWSRVSVHDPSVTHSILPDLTDNETGRCNQRPASGSPEIVVFSAGRHRRLRVRARVVTELRTPGVSTVVR